MHTSHWNDSWLFWQEKDAFAMVWDIPQNAKPVTLPHDAIWKPRPGRTASTAATPATGTAASMSTASPFSHRKN